MCVRSDYIKSDLCRLVFFFFSFFFSSVSIPLDFGISFRKKRRNICLFCIEILRHISGPLLYIFVLCLECIFFCFPHKVLFISVLPSSISLCDARLCCVSCLVKNFDVLLNLSDLTLPRMIYVTSSNFVFILYKLLKRILFHLGK